MTTYASATAQERVDKRNKRKYYFVLIPVNVVDVEGIEKGHILNLTISNTKHKRATQGGNPEPFQKKDKLPPMTVIPSKTEEKPQDDS